MIAMPHQRLSRSLSKQEEPERLAYAFSRYTVASTLHPDRNEDSLIADRRNGLAAVLTGEVASQIASQVLRRGWRRALQGQDRIQSAAPLALVAPEDLQATLRLLVEEAYEHIRGAGRPWMLEARHALERRIRRRPWPWPCSSSKRGNKAAS